MATSQRQNYVRQERIPVSSAIPSASLTLSSLPRRPNPSGSTGNPETVYANHFKCQFGKNLPLYQYDVAIEELGKTSNQWYEVKGRARCSLIMQSLISNGAFQTNVVVWYDEQKCLYSTSILQTPQYLNTNDGRNRLHIKCQPNQWSTNDIQEYITGKATVYPYDAVRILETLLKKSLANRVEVVNNTCYFVDEQPKKLLGGFEERLGFVQALNLARDQITLNIQTKLTSFYPEMSLIEFIHLQIGEKRIPNENERRKLERILKNCLIVTQQSNWKQAYEFHLFDKRTPNLISIESGESLIEYYKSAKNITLKHLNYPCIEVFIPNEYRKSCHLPLEVCRIKAWQVYDKPLSKAQETQQPRKQIPSPDQRYSAIMNIVRKCDYNSQSNRLCREVQFEIIDNEMLKLNGRILTQPQIASGQSSQVNIRIGSIPLNGHLFTPKPISALAITYFGKNANEQEAFMQTFSQTLLDVMKTYHVDVRPQNHTVDSTIEQITRYFQTMQERNCKFVVCVMHGRNEEEIQQIHLHIKDSANKCGLMTQCAVLSKIQSCRSMRNYCENLLRKINYKNSGINTKVNLTQAIKNKKSQTDAFMFFGADVIHPTNVTRQHPSIAAVVGSGDSLCSTTASRVCQQYPREGKCSIETILGLQEMVEELLDYYQQANRVLPNKIVFYRDGVDDGQFGKVIAHELPLIRQAFDRMYGNDNHPRLTILIVKKRHNTRFFTYNQSTDQTKNLSIGVVVDTTIVHPYQNNFYLNSHHAFQGVNHPSLYHVLLDEIGFTADELQLLTYHLCFTDPRSSASEAIPSVVHQADLAALKARDLFYNDEGSSNTSIGGRSQPLNAPTLNDLDYKILDVHENLRNRPVFA